MTAQSKADVSSPFSFCFIHADVVGVGVICKLFFVFRRGLFCCSLQRKHVVTQHMTSFFPPGCYKIIFDTVNSNMEVQDYWTQGLSNRKMNYISEVRLTHGTIWDVNKEYLQSLCRQTSALNLQRPMRQLRTNRRMEGGGAGTWSASIGHLLNISLEVYFSSETW